MFQQCPDEFIEETISDNNEPPETIKLWRYKDFEGGYMVYLLENSDE